MDYSNLTKKQVIEGIKNQEIDFFDLSQENQEDKEIVLEALKNGIYVLGHTSFELRND